MAFPKEQRAAEAGASAVPGGGPGRAGTGQPWEGLRGRRTALLGGHPWFWWESHPRSSEIPNAVLGREGFALRLCSSPWHRAGNAGGGCFSLNITEAKLPPLLGTA